MIPAEYFFLIFLNWFILFIGFKQKDFGIVGISGLFLMSLGVYSLTTNYGVDIFIRNTLGVVSFGLGFYISIRSTIELLKLKPDEGDFNFMKLIKEIRRKQNGIEKERKDRSY